MATANFEEPRDVSYLNEDFADQTPRRSSRTESEIRRIAAQAAGITSDPSMFDTVSSELAVGEERTVSALESSIREQKQVEAEELATFVAAGEGPTSQKIKELQAIALEAERVNLSEEFDNAMVQSARATGQKAQEQQAKKALSTTVRERNAEYFRKLGPEILSFQRTLPAQKIVDTAAAVMLPGYALNLSEVLKKSNPAIDFGGGEVLAGTMLDDYISALDSMPEDESRETLRELVIAIEENKFFGVENGYLKFDLFQTVLDSLDSQEVPEALYNILGILDLVPAIELVRLGYLGNKAAAGLEQQANIAQKTVLSGEKTPGSVSERLDELAPEDSYEVHKEILETGNEQAANNLGTDLGELGNVHLAPRPIGASINAAPDILDSLERKLHFRGVNSAFTPEEKALTMNRVNENKAKMIAVMPDIHLNKSSVEEVAGGYEMTALISPSYRGFASLSDALNHAKTIRDDLYSGMKVKVEDSRTGMIEDLDDVPAEFREKGYYLELKQRENFYVTDALPINPVLKDGLTGNWAKWATKSASFIKPWVYGGDVADQYAAKQKALNRLLEPLSSLRGKNQNKVLALIDEGDVAEKWFTRDELLERWQGDPAMNKLIRGYESFLAFHREARQLLNDAAYNQAIAQDLKHVNFPKMRPLMGEQDRLGKAIPEPPEGHNLVFDPTRSTLRNLSDTEMQAISEAGGFIELTGRIGEKGQYTRYAINDTSVRINELPHQILRDTPGYVTRTYDVNYFLVKGVRGVDSDGTPYTSHVKLNMARDRGTAEEMRDSLNDAELYRLDDPEAYQVVDARELDPQGIYQDRASLEYFEEWGELFFSSRGQEMMGIDGQRMVQPISDRLAAFRDAASRSGTLDFVVQKFINNWEKMFGPQFGDKGRINLFGDLPEAKPATSENKRLRAHAIAARNHIKMLMGVDDSKLTQSINRAAVWVADRLATPSTTRATDRLRNRSAEFVVNLRDSNVVNWPKQAAFLQWIVANPARQLMLQAQQASVYLSDKGAMKYFASGKGVQDYFALMTGLASRDTATWGKVSNAWAKQLGMSVDEYTEFVDAVRVTGLMDNVDSHAFTAVMSVDRTMGGGEGFAAFRHNSGETFKSVARVLRSMGFDAGEKAQLLTAFLVKKNRWQLENPKIADQWAKGGNLTEIAAGARQISFGMNQADILQFQKGALGTIFQFMSHNTKAAQVLIPQGVPGLGRLSNKGFSNRQRAALLATQFGMYGTGAFGLYSAYDSLKADLGEPPEEVDQLIKEGLFGSVMQMLFSVADNPDMDVNTRLDASGRIAPFSGIAGTPASRLIETQLLTDISLSDIPGYSTASSVAKAVRTVGYLTGVGIAELVDIDEATGLPRDENTQAAVLKTLAALVPSYNNIMKAKAQFAVERFITGSGNLGVQATAGEILANAAFGFQPTRRREVEGTLRTLRGISGDKEQEAYAQGLRDHGKMIYQTAVQILQRSDKEPVATMDELEQTIQNFAVVDKVLLDDFDYEYIYKEYIPELIYSSPVDAEDATLQDQQEWELIDLLQKMVDKGTLENTDTILDKVKNFDEFQGKDDYIDWLESIRE